MTTNEYVNNFLKKVGLVKSQMKVLGEDVDKNHVIEEILRSMIHNFDTLQLRSIRAL